MSAVMSEQGQVHEAKEAKREVKSVQMNDGRTVEFAGKHSIKKELIVEGDQAPGVRIDFANGETVTFQVPEQFIAQAAAHGISQKLGDATAGVKSLDDAVEAVQAVIRQIQEGNWNAKREAGGFAGTSILVRALMEYKNLDRETVRAFLANKSQKEKLAMRNSKTLQPIVARLEAESAKDSGVDPDALMADLGA